MLSGNCTEALSVQANVTISCSSTRLIKNGIAPLPFPSAIESRSADFSPQPSSPAKTAGSGLKSALLSCRNSLNSMAVLPFPLPALLQQYWYIQRGERVRVRGHVPFYATLGLSSKQPTYNPQPPPTTTPQTVKNFPALTSTAFSATFPAPEKDDLRA